MTLLEVLRSSTEYFAKREIESPRLNAELLLAHSLGRKRIELYLDFERVLLETELVPIRDLLRSIRPDVVHFHNLSLIGGPGLLSVPAPGAVKFMTTHEHWLVCPLHVLWKFDRNVCEARDCVRCCVRSGMRWGEDGADAMSHLRALFKSGDRQWDAFWRPSPN